MFSLLGTLLFYDFVIVACFLSCKYYEKTGIKFYKYAPYVTLVFISVFRYDIGADYENTYETISYMSNHPSELFHQQFIDDNSRTPGMRILVMIFQYVSSPSFYVIGCYSIIFISSIFFLLNHYNAHKWGILILFLSLLIFQSWDWIKQSASLGLVACSLVYIDQGKFKKSIFLILIAITFHLSAAFVIPFLFCRKLRLSSHFMSVILIFVFVAAELGFFNTIYNELLQLTPLYGEIYSSSRQYSEMNEFAYRSTSFILFSLWSIFILYFSTDKTRFFNVIFFFGSTMYMISGGSILIDRISIYYTLPQMVIFSFIMKEKHDILAKCIISLMIFANFVLINRRFVEDGDIRGCVPYQTIFSDEYNNHKFRYRAN